MPVSKEWVIWKLTDADIRQAAGTAYSTLTDKSKAKIAKNVAKQVFDAIDASDWQDILDDEIYEELD